jgi:hypothetical protein
VDHVAKNLIENDEDSSLVSESSCFDDGFSLEDEWSGIDGDD